MDGFVTFRDAVRPKGGGGESKSAVKAETGAQLFCDGQ